MSLQQKLPTHVILEHVFKFCDPVTRLTFRHVNKEIRHAIPALTEENWTSTWALPCPTKLRMDLKWSLYSNTPVKLAIPKEWQHWQKIVLAYSGDLQKECEACGCRSSLSRPVVTYLSYMYRMCKSCIHNHVFPSSEVTADMLRILGKKFSKFKKIHTYRDLKHALSFLFEDKEVFELNEARRRLEVEYCKKTEKYEESRWFEEGVKVPVNGRSYFKRFVAVTKTRSPKWNRWIQYEKSHQNKVLVAKILYEMAL